MKSDRDQPEKRKNLNRVFVLGPWWFGDRVYEVRKKTQHSTLSKTYMEQREFIFLVLDIFRCPSFPGPCQFCSNCKVPHMHCELVTKRVHCVAGLRSVVWGSKAY